MQRRWFRETLINLFTCSLGVFFFFVPSAEGSLEKTLFSQVVRDQTGEYAHARRAQILNQSSDPKNIQNIMSFLYLKNQVWKFERDPGLEITRGGKEAYSAEAQKFEGLIFWPDRKSAQGRLLLEYLYFGEILPLALESRVRDGVERHQSLLERKALDASELRESAVRLARLVKLKGQLESAWESTEEQRLRAAELNREIALEYEAYLLTLMQLPPTEGERALSFIASAFTEVALTAGAIAIAGEDPQNVLAWMGLTATGLIAKAIEAALAKNAVILVPFVGPLARSEDWLRNLQSLGKLPSQRAAQRDYHLYAGLNETHWSSIKAAHALDCASHFQRIAEGYIRDAEYPVTNGAYVPWSSGNGSL